MSELISREEAERFLELIDAGRGLWRFRADHDDGRAEEFIATFDDAFSRLCELNRREFEIFVSGDVVYIFDDIRGVEPVEIPLPPDFFNFCFFAGLSDIRPGDSDQIGTWDGVLPHIGIRVGEECMQYVWRVAGLRSDKACGLRRAVGWSLGTGCENIGRGFAYLPGFATRMGAAYGAPYPARIVEVRDAAPYHGLREWEDHLRGGCYAGEALAEHERRQVNAAGGGAGDDDDLVLAALRAATAAGDRVPTRAGTHATAWHVLRTFPELGAALANRKGRDRVHTALRHLQQAGKVRRVEGRTAGRRECEFFEAVPG